MRKIINLERFIKNKVIREWVEALIFAVIVAAIFRTWFFSPYGVPTGSMIPTIKIGDYLFANMHAYGYVVPFTDIKLFPSKVERGDIVIFPSPIDSDKDYIKRAVAVEGDVVEIVGEIIYINGKAENYPSLYYDRKLPPVVYNWKFAVSRKFTVPIGKVWTLGDNRRNSLDGRFWGFVDLKDIRAQGMFIHWSHDPGKSIFTGYKLDRIGKWLE